MLKSSTIVETVPAGIPLDPVTPGELLREEFLVPLGISQYRLAKETGIPVQRIGQIVLGRRSITAVPVFRAVRWLLAARAGCIRHRGRAPKART